MKFIRALYLIAALSASSTGMMAQTQSSGYFLHTITKGQSLYSIASMYNVTTGDIVKMNPGSDQKIKTGETLKIPQKNIGTEQQMFHTIQSGETLYKLTPVSYTHLDVYKRQINTLHTIHNCISPHK